MADKETFFERYKKISSSVEHKRKSYRGKIAALSILGMGIFIYPIASLIGYLLGVEPVNIGFILLVPVYFAAAAIGEYKAKQKFDVTAK